MNKTADGLPNAHFTDLKPTTESFLDAVIDGLSQKQKTLSPKFFYDGRGSRLFDEICVLPEYYPTRTEIRIITDNRDEMSALIPDGSQLVEFGAGNSLKVRVLLRAVARFASYVPIDISGDYLWKVVQLLAEDFPAMDITAISADYTQPFDLPGGDVTRVGFFPGSTIGNMTHDQAVDFLQTARRLLGAGSGMLIGADLRKDEETLLAAYNDRLGVTAAFNKNILKRINEELDGNFDLEAFDHQAVWNAEKSQVEMHLLATSAQTATIGGQEFSFREGESIHTENSHKFTLDSIARLMAEGGFTIEKSWTDKDKLFSVHYAVAK